MYKKSFIFLLFMLAASALQAQYYYLDHISRNQASDNFKLLLQNKVSEISLSSVNREGEEDSAFTVTQYVNAAVRSLQTISKTAGTNANISIVMFDEQFRPVQNIDSVEGAKTTVRFYYNRSNGWLDSAVAVSANTLQEYSFTEKRIYLYKQNGQPEQMFWVKNLVDTTIVVFDSESGSQPEIERWFRRGIKTETYYYYYNGDKGITDVVRYYRTVNKLLPVYTFTYNENGTIQTQTNFAADSNDYTIYQYQYNESGLKVAESIFNKSKQQIGRIVYTYFP